MSFRIAELGQVCSFENGDRGKNYPSRGSFVAEGVPFVNAGNLKDGKVDIDSLHFITPEHFKRLSNGKIREGDILFCLRGSLGKSALVSNIHEGAIASSLVIIRVSKGIDLHFLKHYLVSSLCEREIDRFANGAAQPNLAARDLKKFQIPIPPIQEQIRIASILDKADEICRKRYQAIQLAEEFLKSLFLDMFGDPVVNDQKWPIKKLSELGTLERGKSRHRPRNDPELLGGPYPLIQTGDVAKSGGYITKYNSTYSELGLKQSRLWPAETLCITIAANIASTGILKFDACFPDSVVGFTPNDITTAEFIQTWISFLKLILERNAPQVAQKNINLQILRNLDVIHPPVGKQIQFTRAVRKCRQMNKQLVEAEKKSDQLSKSLAQRFFEGGISCEQEK